MTGLETVGMFANFKMPIAFRFSYHFPQKFKPKKILMSIFVEIRKLFQVESEIQCSNFGRKWHENLNAIGIFLKESCLLLYWQFFFFFAN